MRGNELPEEKERVRILPIESAKNQFSIRRKIQDEKNQKETIKRIQLDIDDGRTNTIIDSCFINDKFVNKLRDAGYLVVQDLNNNTVVISGWAK